MYSREQRKKVCTSSFGDSTIRLPHLLHFRGFDLTSHGPSVHRAFCVVTGTTKESMLPKKGVPGLIRFERATQTPRDNSPTHHKSPLRPRSPGVLARPRQLGHPWCFRSGRSRSQAAGWRCPRPRPSPPPRQIQRRPCPPVALGSVLISALR